MSRSESTVETEVKIRVADAAGALNRLHDAGLVQKTPRLFEVNQVFDRPTGEIRARGELLRIRRVADNVIITYKGKAEVGVHKSREELEISVSDFATCEKIFLRIGFVQIFRYEKYRTEFHRPGEPGIVTLDETPIGTFLELEGSPEWIDTLANLLGFRPADYVTASYGGLYLEYCRANGLPDGDMVFR